MLGTLVRSDLVQAAEHRATNIAAGQRSVLDTNKFYENLTRNNFYCTHHQRCQCRLHK
jgi:hypothetical protein